MHVPMLHTMDTLGPLLAALVFMLTMSLVREPARMRFNAILVAGAGAAYMSAGLGLLELAYPVIATPLAYLGLRSHRFIGLAWLMHSSWDLLHHLYGHPIWPFMSTSSYGCMIFDALIASWFMLGAPSLFASVGSRMRL